MKYLFASLLICLSVSVHAQQNHFIYIQADNRQPFYVKLDKKLLSSSASGYLIIPKLQDSSYDLSIGFPKNEWPEQKVTCNINRTDVGYLLKNFGEKGWGLFNFQTMDLLMAETKAGDDSSKAVVTNNDPFSNALANVVNDPAIKAVEEIKEDSIAVTAPVTKTPAKKIVKAPAKAKGKDLAVSKPKDRISKLLSRRNADSLKIVYVDKVNGSADTVNVVIPIGKPVAKIIPPKIPKVDTSAVAKHIVSTRKPLKKPAKADLTKANKKLVDKAKDSTALVSIIKEEKPKTDLALEKNQPISNDTVTIDQSAKKLEDIIADMTKADNKIVEPVKDTTTNAIPEIKTGEPKKDLVLGNKDSVIVVIDTTATVLQSTVGADSKVPAIDSVINTSAENKVEPSKPEPAKEIIKEPTTPPVDTSVTTSAEKPGVKKVETIVQDKKPEVQGVVEKPKEDITAKTSPAASVYVCKYVADGDEFMNLRKKMLKGKSDNEMLFSAHQLFLKRCVTTKQVERLAVLFTNDLAKYNLFDDAYHYTVDLDIFPTLQSQLADEYYIKRFKAMLRQ